MIPVGYTGGLPLEFWLPQGDLRSALRHTGGKRDPGGSGNARSGVEGSFSRGFQEPSARGLRTNA